MSSDPTVGTRSRGIRQVTLAALSVPPGLPAADARDRDNANLRKESEHLAVPAGPRVS